MVITTPLKIDLTGPYFRAFSFLGIALVGAVSIGLWLVPQFGIGPGLALIVVISASLTLVKPILGFGLLVFSIPIVSVLLVGEGVAAPTLSRFIGIFVIGSWLLQKLIRRESWSDVLTANLLLPILLFALLVVASLLWVRDIESAAGQVLTVVQLAVLGLLTITKGKIRKLVRENVKAMAKGAIQMNVSPISRQMRFFDSRKYR